MVPWGSNWTLKTFDFTMPNVWTGDGGMPTNNVPAGTQVPVQYICPWLQISANYGSGTIGVLPVRADGGVGAAGRGVVVV